MQFLNPLFLLGSLAAFAPILIHLVRKEESKRILFSSLMFVNRIPRKSWRRQELRHLLLLMMRIGALLLLALAFARPFLTSKISLPVQSLKDKSLVILLDNSFSMRFDGRFDRARKLALQLVGELGSGDSVQIVTFSDIAQVLNSPHPGRGTLSTIINSLQPTYRKTNYNQALKLASQLLASAPNELREICWISDFHQSGWNADQEQVTLDEKIKVRTYDVSDNDIGNATVDQVQISEARDQQHSLVKTLARVSAYGLKAKSRAMLQLELNGKVIQEKQVLFETDGSQLVEFNSFTKPPGVATGGVHLVLPDPLPADNVLHFVLNQQRELKVLLLGERQAKDNFYMGKALSASPDSPFTIEIQDAKAAASYDLAPYAAVVLNNLELIPPKLALSLHSFVNSGGGVILVLGSRVKPSDYDLQLDRILPARLTSMFSSAVAGKEMTIAEIQRKHFIFNIFEAVHQSYFMTTSYSGYFRSTPQKGSHVLVSLEDGNPLLIEGTMGKGRTLLFTSSFNMNWNDLPLKSVFLPFCQQLVKYCVNYEESRIAFTTGEVVSLSKLNPLLIKALNDASTISSSFSQSWKVVKPSGENIELNSSDLTKSPYFTLEEPGFYQTTVHNFRNWLAVNVDPTESDLRRIDPEIILSSFKRRTNDALVSRKPMDSSLDQRLIWESRQSLWWFLLIAAVIILLVESFLANRYYKNIPEIE